MTRRALVPALAAAALLAAGAIAASACGGSSAPSSPADTSCTTYPPSAVATVACSCGAGGATCDDYSNAATCQTFLEPDGGSTCAAGSASACPAAARVGTCFGTETAVRYYAPAYTTSTAQAACAALAECFVAN